MSIVAPTAPDAAQVNTATIRDRRSLRRGPRKARDIGALSETTTLVPVRHSLPTTAPHPPTPDYFTPAIPAKGPAMTTTIAHIAAYLSASATPTRRCHQALEPPRVESYRHRQGSDLRF